MKIERIKSIKGHRTYRDFSWPAALRDFGRFNLIYGWNGTGKTTLSNLFTLIQKREALSLGECTFIIDGREVKGRDFATDVALPNVRVFNQDFVRKHVFTPSRSLTPIFYHSEKSFEAQQEIIARKARLSELSEDLPRLKATLDAAQSALDNFNVDRANNVIKPLLRSNGDNIYNNYNKTHFSNKCEELSRLFAPSAHILTEDEEFDLMSKKNEPVKPELPLISFEFSDLTMLRKQVDNLLACTVVSAILEDLRADERLSGWIRDGLHIHRDKQSKKCQFCGNEITPERLETFEAHFNDHYEQFLREIDSQIQCLQSLIKSLDGVRIHDGAKLYSYLNERYTLASAKLIEEIKDYKSVLNRFISELAVKKSVPFQEIASAVAMHSIEFGSLTTVNNVIHEHNDTSAQHGTICTDARKRLEESRVAAALPIYREKKNAIETAEEAYKKFDNECRSLRARIDELEREVLDHAQPAHELNADLRAYLGHGDLQLEPAESGYRIKRHDLLATDLSEGEETAIAFLFFLKSLEDKDFSLKDGIVVIDDPVSSLDTNALFYAFAFLKDRTKAASQLFILTHNFALFRQVKNWFDFVNRGTRKKGATDDAPNSPAAFFSTTSFTVHGERGSRITKLDPLLRNFESDYHYLFNRVLEGASEDGIASETESYYDMPNIARRLLEAFLSFRVPNHSSLNAQLEAIKFDPEKSTRIYRFLNTFSHHSFVDEPQIDPSALAETPSVMSHVIELIQTEDPRHFAEMKSLIDRHRAQDESASSKSREGRTGYKERQKQTESTS
ncbi:MAG TPA: AAA family ATPase [bacterium]|jgi:wobble nucleotide-excising tRNase